MASSSSGSKAMAEKSLEKRLNYLWDISNEAVKSVSVEYSNLLSLKMANVAYSEDTELPDNMQNSLCCHCCRLLIPSVTARVKISSKSKECKRKGVTNQLVYTCFACNVQTKVNGKPRKRQQSKTQRNAKRKIQTIDSDKTPGSKRKKEGISVLEARELGKLAAGSVVAASGGAPPKLTLLEQLEQKNKKKNKKKQNKSKQSGSGSSSSLAMLGQMLNRR